MSYLKKVKIEVLPEELPKIKRNCPKCNEKTIYINSEKFRVNANKNNIDVGLIYKCERCKSTFNMSIYERVNPNSVDKDEYKKFLANDKDLAKQYSFNLSTYKKNKAEIDLEKNNYSFVIRNLEKTMNDEDKIIIEVISNYPLSLRADKFLSNFFKIKRVNVKEMFNSGSVYIKNCKNSFNTKISDKTEICILKSYDKYQDVINRFYSN